MAKFDFARALALSERSMNQKAIEAIILAPSGGGKSGLMGTFGVPTLYIYSTGESHGPGAAAKQAKVCGSTILPVCMDLDDDGNKLEGDAVISRVVDVLADAALFVQHGIKAIAIDGAAELETYIRSSQKWKTSCLSASGKHNSFAEPAATCEMFRPIFNRLKELQRTHNVHFAMSAMLDVREYGETNDIVEAAPRAKGYQVAEMLIQQFGDVLVVSPRKKDGKIKFALQFMTDVTKVAKDERGNTKRAINFSPRIKGATPPPYMEADLRAVIELKENG